MVWHGRCGARTSGSRNGCGARVREMRSGRRNALEWLRQADVAQLVEQLIRNQ
jgi:hypothetical protein